MGSKMYEMVFSGSGQKFKLWPDPDPKICCQEWLDFRTWCALCKEKQPVSVTTDQRVFTLCKGRLGKRLFRAAPSMYICFFAGEAASIKSIYRGCSQVNCFSLLVSFQGIIARDFFRYVSYFGVYSYRWKLFTFFRDRSDVFFSVIYPAQRSIAEFKSIRVSEVESEFWRQGSRSVGSSEELSNYISDIYTVRYGTLIISRKEIKIWASEA
jgi:hypothetical protein